MTDDDSDMPVSKERLYNLGVRKKREGSLQSQALPVCWEACLLISQLRTGATRFDPSWPVLN